MSTYIIKVNRRDRHLRYATVEADALTVQYVQKMRPVRQFGPPGFRMTEVESVGPDKSRMTLDSQHAEYPSGSRTPTGQLAVVNGQTIKDTVRVLAGEDVDLIAEFDAEIARRQEQVRIARGRRAEHVLSAWRRAKPASWLDLKDEAEATLAERSVS